MTSHDEISPPLAPIHVPSNCYGQQVTYVHHYTPELFTFRLTRPLDFRFRSGEFVMIGLPHGDRPIFRAYSLASPAWDDELAFYSIKVPNGPLTQHLQKIQIGDYVLMKKKSTGTLVLDALLPGKRLWLLSTGTGVAPFASLIREPETWEKFQQVILVHTCRYQDDLVYSQQCIQAAKDDPLVGEMAQKGLFYYPTTTRQESRYQGRCTALLQSHQMEKDLNLPWLNVQDDRVMICGSAAMLQDLKNFCLERQFEEGANNRPGNFVIERAFVS